MQHSAAHRPQPKFFLPPKIGPDMDIERFVRVQDQPLQQETEYERAIRELQGGKKLNHWIWFIFPQVFGLGRQLNSRLYGIKSVDEAKAYLAHPVLGPRLRAATEAVLDSGEKDLVRLFGEELDAIKFKSSITLFAWISVGTGDDFYLRVLMMLWGGCWDEKTLRILKKMGR
ncbi:hypothetical protein VP1G_04945 [Cytospora mali]|uniref:Calpastatin n=1 Tax=Cytospora mali TaxID=578113 RepID=A0A194V161_CYTMA|nr:hypothetical protein VP1G_04945 [Valsa mali var. pyri (nom. inval.)]